MEFKPHLYWKSGSDTTYKTLYGSPVKRIDFDNIWDFQKALKEYGDIPGELWGMENPIYQYLVEEFGKETLSPGLLNVTFMDIEVNSVQEVDGELVDGGFPRPEEAKFPITAICQHSSYDGLYIIFTTAEWKREDSCLHYADKIRHVYCRDEKELLQKWLKYNEEHPIHILSGWNFVLFDLPYIVNRLRILFGDREVKRLSPWGIVEEKETKDDFGNIHTTYDIAGINVIDQEDAYKKYRLIPREKYGLGYIMEQEFPEDEKKRKLEFEEKVHGELYLRNPQLHTDYCTQDVYCTVELEKALRLIFICTNLSYMSCVNIGDNFATTRVWDNRFYKTCEQRNIAVPLKHPQHKQDYQGAHVFEVVPGLHKAIVSFDLTSLYPSCLRVMNCGPETLVTGERREKIYHELLSQAKKQDRELYEALRRENLEDYFVDHLKFPEWFTKILQDNHVAMSPICVFFDTENQSIMAELTTETFLDRKKYKKIKQAWEKRVEAIEERIQGKDVQSIPSPEGMDIEPMKDISRMSLEELKEYKNYCTEQEMFNDIMQLCLKILINSLYGCAANSAFRFYLLEIAASITSLGRMVIRSSERTISSYVNHLVGDTTDQSRAVAGDTDSVYVDLYPLIVHFGMEDKPQKVKVEFLDKACEKINEKAIKPLYKDIFESINGEKHNSKTLNMDREAICVCEHKDSYCGFWLAAKHYFLLVNDMEGLRYDTPHVKEMGVQWKQTSYCGFARKNMSNLVKILTKDGIEEFRKELKEVKKKFYELPVEEMAFPRGVSEIVAYTDPKTGLPWEGKWWDAAKGKERNGGVPAHCKAAIRHNYLLKKCGLENTVQKMVNGAKILYVHLLPNEYGFDTVAFRDKLPKEFGLEEFIDKDTMWQKQIYKIMDDVCTTCGLSIEKRRKMSDFF